MSELGPPGLLEQVRTTIDGLQRPLEAGAFVRSDCPGLHAVRTARVIASRLAAKSHAC